MKMTTRQARAYCTSKAIENLGNEEIHQEWNRLGDEVERNGLEEVEARLTTRPETQGSQEAQRASNISVVETFLSAISDEDAVKHAIAGELKERVKEEIDKQSTFPLRMLYLQFLRNFLGNVQDEAANLEDYTKVKEEIEKQVAQLEAEYGNWIEEAIAAQDD